MNEYQFCKDDWKIAARNIFLCVIGVVILTPITVIFASYASVGIVLEAMGRLVSKSESWPDTIASVTSILLLALLVWYIMSLTKFKNSQISDESASAVGTIRTCVVVQLAGVLIFLLCIVSPALGSVLFILWCIALIVMQFIIKDAYRNLSEDETWSKVARRGASQVKTSVAYTIYGMFAPILWFLLFVLTILLVAGSKDMSWQVIIYDIVQGNYTAYLLPFFVLLICCLIQLYWGIMSFVLMLLGWNNIQSGALVNPDLNEVMSAKKNVAASNQAISNAALSQNEATPSFCSECGVKLTPGSKFCPSCGKPLMVVAVQTEEVPSETCLDIAASVALSEMSSSESTADLNKNEDETAASYPVTPEPALDDNESEGENNRKKWLYVGIGAGVVILGAICLFLFAGNNEPDGPVSFVSDDNASVFEGIEDSMISDIVGELEYGDSVVTYETDPSGELIKIKALKNGENITGYVYIDRLLDKESFKTLQSHGHFDNSNVRTSISDSRYRAAIARTLRDLGPDWSLQTTTLKNETSPSIMTGSFKGLPENKVGFAFLAVNNSTGDKHFYLFTHDYMYSENYDHELHLIYDEPVDKKWNAISNISLRKNKVKVKYSSVEDEGADIENEEADDYAAQYADDHTAVFKGMVDGKYPITMRLMVMGPDISGSYYYDKYKTEIPLNGEFSFNENGDKLVILTETNDGIATGQFIGTWSVSTFSGSWISADGEREMNFTVSL